MKYGIIQALAITALLAGGTVSAADVAKVSSGEADGVLQDSVLERSRERARLANEHAAERAIDEALAEIRLDLDIRLAGRTSARIAAKRDRATAR